MPEVRRRPYWLAALAALLVALATRTIPMWWSPLPFNPDGIHAARLAAAGLGDGRFPLSRMATDDLLFPPLLATVGSVLGVAPMRLAQPLSALVGALPGLVAIPVVRRLAARWGWPARRAFAAATLAGVLLAVEGLYLHRSAPTDEQTVGLLFVPLAAVVLARAHASGRGGAPERPEGTGRRAWWLAAAPLLVAVVPLHNLDGMVLALVLSVAAGLVVAQAGMGRAVPLAALAGGFWTYYAAYHFLAPRALPVYVHQHQRVTDVPGLLVAWVALVAIGLAWYVGTRRRTQRLLAGGAFGLMFGLVALNAAAPVFPGTQSTPLPLLAGLLPLVVPALLAAWAGPAAVETRSEGLALGALLGAPLVIVGVSLSASLTPDYLNTAYRASTFLHFPVLVLAAVGTVALGARLAGRARAVGRPRLGTALRVGLAASVVLASAASIPVAFAGLSLLSYQGVTTPAELGASTFATEHANGTWASDDHLDRIGPRGGANGTVAPTYDWVHGGSEPPDCLVLAKASWTEVGAQFFPAPPERLREDRYREWVRTGTVVYRGGDRGDGIVGVAPRGESC